MTDKQIKLDGSSIPMEDAIKARLINEQDIIIDGIDVTTCGHFARFEGKTQNACYIMEKIFIGKEEVEKEYCYCGIAPNCYYKQLKRAEQKLAKIEEVITHHYCNPQIAHTGCKYDEMILQIIEGKDNE